MKLEWGKVFELAIEDVDLQHHYFLNLINRLEVIFKKYQSPEDRKRYIEELASYALFHFKSEENIALSLDISCKS